MKKYKLSSNTKIVNGVKLTQIEAIADFNDVEVGDLGGWIESEQSLSSGVWIHGGDVYKNAKIFGGAIYDGEIHGGEIYDGEIHGGEIYDGDIHDGVIYGGSIFGGIIYGGVIYDGVIRGGEIHGGEIYGGDIHGGDIHDGVILRGGVIRGGEFTKDNHIGFNNVCSENGYLLAYVDNNKIMMSRGCFHGTIDEFYEAVDEAHGDNEHATFYKAIRPVIELKLNKFINNQGVKKMKIKIELEIESDIMICYADFHTEAPEPETGPECRYGGSPAVEGGIFVDGLTVDGECAGFLLEFESVSRQVESQIEEWLIDNCTNEPDF